MPDGADSVSVEVHGRVADIPAVEWDACAGTANPFVRHAFLLACEESGSAARDTGWLPQHLALSDAKGRVQGVVPVYVKGHSFGEYVFDHGWADAFERAGGQYYPKLLCGAPFSPVTGPRLLVRPGTDTGNVQALLIEGLLELTRRHGVSSVHVNFCTEAEARMLADAGFLCRVGKQFHWHNRDYGSFGDFLGDLASRKRKTIRKERERAAESGLKIRTLCGEDIEARHWDAFYRFYLDTVDRKWAHAYLNRAFFRRLGETLGDRVVLIVAEDAGEPVAAALNLRGDDALYGRNWGCKREYPFLHFECCYYRAIDYAIEHGLPRVEAGAGGAHKLQRGYLPHQTFSAHWIAHPGFRDAVARFLVHESSMVDEEVRFLNAAGPFRADRRNE
ncbi:MAG: GNAT family N-acetyltransferase [Acetobacterales bacterium]